MVTSMVRIVFFLVSLGISSFSFGHQREVVFSGGVVPKPCSFSSGSTSAYGGEVTSDSFFVELGDVPGAVALSSVIVSVQCSAKAHVRAGFSVSSGERQNLFNYCSELGPDTVRFSDVLSAFGLQEGFNGDCSGLVGLENARVDNFVVVQSLGSIPFILMAIQVSDIVAYQGGSSTPSSPGLASSPSVGADTHYLSLSPGVSQAVFVDPAGSSGVFDTLEFVLSPIMFYPSLAASVASSGQPLYALEDVLRLNFTIVVTIDYIPS